METSRDCTTEITVTISDNNDASSSSSIKDRPTPSSSVIMPCVSQEPRLEILIPEFSFTRAWNPLHGIDFLGLMSLPEPAQADHVCKMTRIPARRRLRRAVLNEKLTGQDRLGRKRLFHAASENDDKTVEELLVGGLDPCVCDDKKRSALHIAASKGHDRIVSVLVKHGADPNMRDCIGNTPLHLAVCCNHLGTVSLLLEAGTDPRSLDNSGRTPMHLAQARINLLQRELDEGQAALDVKHDVMQVAEMMNRYLKVRGDDDSVGELTDLCHRLELSNTREELISVNNLLHQFTNMTLVKR